MKSLLEAIRPTFFLESEKLKTFLNLDLTIATETFQHTGSFKFRAAYNTALNVAEDHLITASSGNFGQALAFACKLLKKKMSRRHAGKFGAGESRSRQKLRRDG